MRRFKTGTPARIHRDSIDFSEMSIQEGDKKITPFSFLTDNIGIKQEPCYLTRTNLKTHEIIMNNLERTAMYSGQADSTDVYKRQKYSYSSFKVWCLNVCYKPHFKSRS